MTDPAELATTAVAMLSPYLAAGGTEAAKALGKESAAGVVKLLGWLKGRLTGSGAEALAEVETAPRDVGAQGALRIQVRRLLEGDAALVGELEVLLASLPEQAAGPSLVQQGDQNRAAVVGGRGNTVNVS
ncbi:MAG: hypothetical protein WAS21_30405 [Geminicoccaceae bacterium]